MDWHYLGVPNGNGDDGAFEPEECTSDGDSDRSDAETSNFDLDEDDLDLVSQNVFGPDQRLGSGWYQMDNQEGISRL